MSYHNSVRAAKRDGLIYRAGEPFERLVSSLSPKDKLIRFGEKTLDRSFELELRGEIGCAPPVMLFQTVCYSNRDLKRTRDNPRCLNRFRLFA